MSGEELFFTGMSEICMFKGNILHRSSTENEECVIIDIDPQEALDKNINPHNNLFYDRRKKNFILNDYCTFPRKWESHCYGLLIKLKSLMRMKTIDLILSSVFINKINFQVSL